MSTIDIMKIRKVFLQAALFSLIIALGGCSRVDDSVTALDVPAKPVFTIGWTSYVGWVPWEYAERAGIVKKWADFYGVQIEIVQYSDYSKSLALFSEGRIHGVTSTLIDLVTSVERDSTILIPGDYSYGNDGICSKSATTMRRLADEPVYLAELSVSHYLLERARELSGLSPHHPKIINTPDTQIEAVFHRQDVEHVVTWNPHLQQICEGKNTNLIFDSTKIPTEILDALVVDAETLQKHPALGDALLKIWFETIELIHQSGLEARRSHEMMASLLGVSLKQFESQLKKTNFFRCTADALQAVSGPRVKDSLGKIQTFLQRNKPDSIGQRRQTIGYKIDDEVFGDPATIRLRFNNKRLQELSAACTS
jgi:NitT/TauT family transport system substrate-binding protein